MTAVHDPLGVIPLMPFRIRRVLRFIRLLTYVAVSPSWWKAISTPLVCITVDWALRGVSTRGPCSASKGDGDGARCSAPNTTALSEGEDDKSLICNSWSFISSSCMSEAAVEPRGVETTSTETSFGVLPPLAPFFGLRRRGDGMPVWSVPVVVGVRVEWRGVSASTATKRITASLDS